uniref:Uncharacterized protein n=1 Tax=Anguilla anguilla TaxID=7936 RepID=A0A0E9ULA2_ANGAN
MRGSWISFHESHKAAYISSSGNRGASSHPSPSLHHSLEQGP